MSLSDPFPYLTRPSDGAAMTGLRFCALATAVSLVALALRLVGWAPGEGPIGLSGFQLWYDEAFSVLIARRPWIDLLHVARQDVHPPLYYLLLKLWMGLQPDGVSLCGWLRLASALAGAACAPLTIALGTMAGSRRTGLLAGALVAVAPYHVYYSHEIRMYGLGGLIATAGLIALWQFARRPGWRWGCAYCVLGALALYTHYYFFLVLAAQCAGLAVLWGLRDGWQAACFRLTLTVFGVFVLYLPWFPVFLTHGLNNTGQGVHAFASGATAAEALQHLFEWPLGYLAHTPLGIGAALFGSLGQVFVFGAVVYGLALAGLWVTGRGGGRDRLVFWLAVAVAPAVLTGLYILGPGRFYTRCVIFLLPAIYCLVAQGTLALPRPAYRWAVGGILVATMAASTAMVLKTPTLRDHHGHSHEHFLRHFGEGAIFCSQPFDFLPTAVYDLPADRTFLLNSDRLSLIQVILMGRERMVYNRADFDRARAAAGRADEVLLVISDWDFADPAGRDRRRDRRIADFEERWLAGAYQRVGEALFFPGSAKWVFCGRYRKRPAP